MRTVAQITAQAQAVIAASEALKKAYLLAREVTDGNSVNDPGWNSLTHQDNPLVVDANLTVTGTDCRSTEIANAIGSLNVFRAFWEGSAVATSAWGQNIEKISSPLIST
jgi:hypothetical protein